MGLFDKNNKGIFYDFFDFNKDGKIAWNEVYLAHKIYEDCTKDDEDDLNDFFADLEQSEKYEWRMTCEDGSEYGIDPEDYETEEEYEEALQAEKYAWRDICEDGFEYDLNPEDYETEEEYQEAIDEAREKRESFCWGFTEENSDKTTTVNYLSSDSGFLYAQAIKDNFNLPCSLPDEDEEKEIELSQVLCKIAKRDMMLSLKIWSWCLEYFLPYSQYDEYAASDMSTNVIDDLYLFPDGYITKLVHYMDENQDFRKMLKEAGKEPAQSLPQLIAAAIREKLPTTAEWLFKSGLEVSGNQWKRINQLIEGVIFWCQNYEELESMEYFRDMLFPFVKMIDNGMVQDEIQEWENEIANYIDYMESNCERYAYSRKNVWRTSAPDGKKYGLNPRNYNTEQEYLDSLQEAKYGWRKWYEEQERYGLDVEAFETEGEFRKALNAKICDARQKEYEKRSGNTVRENKTVRSLMEDKTIYTYCGVLLPFSSRPYSFRTDDETIEIGDTVIVPVGEEGKEKKGIVVSVGKYRRIGVPYPVEKTKNILRKEVFEKIPVTAKIQE